MNDEELTQEQKEELKEYLGVGTPVPEEKHNVHSFLYRVATSNDTTKLGNLEGDELGKPRLTLRTYKDLALISKEIIGNDFLAEYYTKQAEILTSTSLSKDAKLINLAVVQKRQIEDLSKPPRKENSGWFKKKDLNQPTEAIS